MFNSDNSCIILAVEMRKCFLNINIDLYSILDQTKLLRVLLEIGIVVFACVGSVEITRAVSFMLKNCFRRVGESWEGSLSARGYN